GETLVAASTAEQQRARDGPDRVAPLGVLFLGQNAIEHRQKVLVGAFLERPRGAQPVGGGRREQPERCDRALERTAQAVVDGDLLLVARRDADRLLRGRSAPGAVLPDAGA